MSIAHALGVGICTARAEHFVMLSIDLAEPPWNTET